MPSDSDDSYFGAGSQDGSRASGSSLEDEEAAGPSRRNGAAALPNPLEAISAVASRPAAFLHPEATRPVAASVHEGGIRQARARAAAAPEGGAAATAAAGEEGPDISRMAGALPKRAGEDEPGAAKRAQGAVISGSAKRYKLDEEGPQYTAAQVALMGGAGPLGDGEEEAEGGGQQEGRSRTIGPARPTPAGAGKPPLQKSSRALPVSEFLNKGLGAALLPRKKQDRKDKEKSKRALGQSSVHAWKSEAEMVLRQQYDS